MFDEVPWNNLLVRIKARYSFKRHIYFLSTNLFRAVRFLFEFGFCFWTGFGYRKACAETYSVIRKCGKNNEVKGDVTKMGTTAAFERKRLINRVLIKWLLFKRWYNEWINNDRVLLSFSICLCLVFCGHYLMAMFIGINVIYVEY